MKLTDTESRTFLLSMLDSLESEKKAINMPPSDRQLICERFAFHVFGIADNEDRAGVASKETARTFNAAATFFDILEQFGELSSEV